MNLQIYVLILFCLFTLFSGCSEKIERSSDDIKKLLGSDNKESGSDDLFASSESKKEFMDIPEDNPILYHAYNNNKFNAEKWLKSDRMPFKAPGRISGYDRIIKKTARRYGFDWRLIAAQIYVESNFKDKVQSPVGALGLMQVMPNTAKFIGIDPQHLTRPEINIRAGCMYNQRMFSLWKRQTDDVQKRLAFSLASYNAGRGRVLRSYSNEKGKNTWKKVGPELPEETQNYVHKIYVKHHFYKKHILP